MTGNQYTPNLSAGQEVLALSEKVNNFPISSDDAKPRTVLVLLASESGTSEDAANSLGRLFQRLRFDVEVKSMDAVELVRHVLSPRFLTFRIYQSWILLLCISRAYRQRTGSV